LSFIFAEWILELDRESYYPFKGNYSEWLKQKEKRLEEEKNRDEQRKKNHLKRVKVGFINF
jgi:sulfate-transporting ATPase